MSAHRSHIFRHSRFVALVGVVATIAIIGLWIYWQPRVASRTGVTVSTGVSPILSVWTTQEECIVFSSSYGKLNAYRVDAKTDSVKRLEPEVRIALTHGVVPLGSGSIVATSDNGCVEQIQPSGSFRRRVPVHRSLVAAICAGHREDVLITCGDSSQKEIVEWEIKSLDLVTNRIVPVSHPFGLMPTAVCASRDGRVLVVAGDGYVWCWKLSWPVGDAGNPLVGNQEVAWRVEGDEIGRPYRLSCDPSMSMCLVSCSGDRDWYGLRVLRLEDGKTLGTLPVERDGVVIAEWGCGDLAVFATRDAVRLWSVVRGELHTIATGHFYPNSLSVNAGRTRFMCGCQYGLFVSELMEPSRSGVR